MMKVDVAAILAAANNMNALNNQLEETLIASKQNIDALRQSWQGTAADTTIDSFDSFAAKYFAEYKSLIEDYVKFLQQVAAGNYEEAEQKVTSLSDLLP